MRCPQVIGEDGTALGVLDGSHTLSIEVPLLLDCA